MEKVDEALVEALKKQVFTYEEIQDKLYKLGYEYAVIDKILLGLVNTRYNG